MITRCGGMPIEEYQAAARSQKPAAVTACLILEDLGVDEAAAVVDGGVHEPVPTTVGLGHAPRGSRGPGCASHPRRNPSQFLHIHMDQLTGPVPLIPLRLPPGVAVARSPRSSRPIPSWWRIACTVEAARPTSKPMCAAPQRRLRRSRITSRRSRGGSGSVTAGAGSTDPAGPAHPRQEPVPPLTHRLGINLEPLRSRGHRPACHHHTVHHPTPSLPASTEHSDAAHYRWT